MEARSLYQQYDRMNEAVNRLTALLNSDAQGTRLAWEESIIPLVDEFEATYRQFADERDRGGFLGSVLDQRPTKSRMVQKLQDRHQEFINMLADVRRQPAVVTEAAGHTDERAARLRELMTRFKECQDETNGLVQHVFCQEIGFPGSC